MYKVLPFSFSCGGFLSFFLSFDDVAQMGVSFLFVRLALSRFESLDCGVMLDDLLLCRFWQIILMFFSLLMMDLSL